MIKNINSHKTITLFKTLRNVTTVRKFNWNVTVMMKMKCFCGMIDQRKVFSLIFRQDHC